MTHPGTADATASSTDRLGAALDGLGLTAAVRRILVSLHALHGTATSAMVREHAHLDDSGFSVALKRIRTTRPHWIRVREGERVTERARGSVPNTLTLNTDIASIVRELATEQRQRTDRLEMRALGALEDEQIAEKATKADRRLMRKKHERAP